MKSDGSLQRSREPQRPSVLLVTPQLQLRAIGTTVLEQAGFQVLVESNGEKLLDQLGTSIPDLILADEQLDDMHAAQLCAKVRQHSVGRTVPILVVSDLCQTSALEGILAEEFTDFITAPLNWKAVTFRIHRWIQVSRKFRSLSDQELDLEQVRDSALKASTELLQLRNYDPVTGLPNREMFLSAVDLMLSRYQRSSGYLAVLHLDIDDFKGVNDVLGRALGDELLRIVAKRLQGCLREGDLVSQAGDQGTMTSFARLNGDQFAILLGSVTDREGAAAVATRLLESLSRPLQIQDRQFTLTARVGIADATHEEEVAEEVLIQRAEIAMRYCKQHGGKPSAFFEGFMDELVQKKLAVKVELRRALDEGELFLCYQLLVDSQTAVPTGVEGLIRWQHPSRGLVPPNEFLPVAEESELIVEIDRWVLREGCRQGRKWLDNGYPPLKMSLNVSMRFLEQEDFAQQVLKIVQQSGLPPETLQLELSERGTLPDPGRIMSQFDTLVSAGVHLALDDFGTGQTSLSYLRTLPISCVKIDQSFVRRIPEDSASEAIVTAIAAMSHHLGLKVVAEGVETEDQKRFLAENDCNQLQGYLFSKPETVARLESEFLIYGPSGYVTVADEEASSPEVTSAADSGRETQSVEIPTIQMPDIDLPALEAPALEVPPLEAPALETPALEKVVPVAEGSAPAPAVQAPATDAPASETPTVAIPKIGEPKAEAQPPRPTLVASNPNPVTEPAAPPPVAARPTTRRSADDPPKRANAREVSDPRHAVTSPKSRVRPAPAEAQHLQGQPADAGDGSLPRTDTDGYLLQLARKDFLTKLYNRYSFDERLEHALAHADRFDHKVALLLIDLDDFKYVNDTHGHAVGDGLLVALAGRLNRLVRKVDTLARLGGDEFAVILSEYHDLKSVTEFARRLLAVLSQPVEVEGQELRVTGSLGVTVYPSGDSQAKDLLRQADLALYKAKSHGGNSARFFAREMDREVQRRLALARDLSGAVDRGELFLEYQLQVALDSGAILGVEALLRWDHPSQGLIGPGRFIPVAESTGEIRAIGRWVISSACALAKRWRTVSGRGVPVSVNLSPVQCRDRGFVDMVLETLKKHDLPPELLNLELNEKLLKQLPRSFEASLKRLNELGVSLTLDNFGSGSSPLEYFQRFSFDRLKIHQSLVRTIGGDSVSASVLSGIVAMARKLGVQIVAEGVEEPEQRVRLQAEGCEVGQGFLFGRPMSEDALTELMTETGAFAEPIPEGLDLVQARKIAARPAQFSTSGPGKEESGSVLRPSVEEPMPSSAEPKSPPSTPKEVLPEIPEELSAEPVSEAPAVAKPQELLSAITSRFAEESTASIDLQQLNRYAASAAPRRRKAGRWSLHALLAAVAFSIWGIILWPSASEMLLSADSPLPAEAVEVGVESPAMPVVTTVEPTVPDPAASTTQAPAAEAGTAAASTLEEEAAQNGEALRLELVDVVQAWALAWSEQRVEEYLKLYANGFTPPGDLNRSEWAAQRRFRILRPKQIEVRLSTIEVEPVSAERALVTFDQSYRSETYSDSVRKTLELIQENGSWKILAERAAD